MKAEKELGQWFLGADLRGDRYETKAGEDLKFSSNITSTNRKVDYPPGGYVNARYFFTDHMHLFAGMGHSSCIPTAVERILQKDQNQ